MRRWKVGSLAGVFCVKMGMLNVRKTRGAGRPGLCSSDLQSIQRMFMCGSHNQEDLWKNLKRTIN